MNQTAMAKEVSQPYEWFSTQATSYLRASAEAHYGCRIGAAGAEVEGIWVPAAILADFTGDALAEPRFLATLARENPTRFG